MDDAVAAYVRGAEAEVPSSVCDDVAHGRCTMLDLVKLLGPSLTSEADEERVRALSLLSRVIEHVAQAPPTTPPALSRQTIRTLTEFFCAKVSDAVEVGDAAARRGNVAPHVPATAPRAAQQAAEQHALAADRMLVDCIRTLTVLSRVVPRGSRDAFSGEDARSVAAALFSLDMRKYPQPLRLLVYELVGSLVEHHLPGLRAMRAGEGLAFVRGYAALVSGEKDPRNLLVHFGTARAVLAAWDVDGGDAEAMYNVLFCYFPISFRPLPDDVHGITPEQLKRALRACVSAAPAFGRMAYPFLLEKLGATGAGAKIDTLQTLSACVPVYGRAQASAHAADLWALLKIDIVEPAEADVAPCAQETLSTLLRELGPDDRHVSMILEACMHDFRELHARPAAANLRILHCFAYASKDVCSMATRRVVPMLLTHAQEGGDAPRATELLALFLEELAHAPQAHTRGLLDASHDALIGVFTKAAAAGGAHAQHGVRGLKSVLELPDLVRGADLAGVAEALQLPALSPNDAVRVPALLGLGHVRDRDADVLATHTVPYLFHHLPQHVDAPPLRVKVVLGALAQLCTTRSLFGALAAHIFCVVSTLGVCAPDPAHAGYACALFAALHVALERKIAAKDADVPACAADVAMRVLAWCGDPAAVLASDAHVMQRACDLLVLVVPHVGEPEAAKLAAHVCAAYALGGAHGPLSADAEARTRALLAPSTAVVVGLRASVPDAEDLFDRALSLAVSPAAMPAWLVSSLHMLLCALANKCVEPNEARLERAWTRIPRVEAPRARQRCLEAWLWTARGWLARHVPFGMTMVERVQRGMRDPALGLAAARALRVMAEPAAFMAGARGFRVRILSRQRVLESLATALLDAYEAHDDAREPCLVGVASLLSGVTDAFVHMRMQSVLAILVHTVGMDDAHTRTASAETLARLLESARGADTLPNDAALHTGLREHLAVLVPRLLENTERAPEHSVRVRLASLKALHALADALPHDALFPCRRRVVQALGVPQRGVDDPARPVRAAAVDCRAAWYCVQALEV